MNDNTLRCETCGKSHFEVPIILKPTKFCRSVNVYELPQKNEDGRGQDNICLSCLTEEVNQIMNNQRFEVEYEIPPLRAIYYENYHAETKEEAIEKFEREHPRGQIRKIKREG